MKKELALTGILILSSACVAGATSFTSTIDFTGSYFTADGIKKDGIYINDTGNPIGMTPGDPGYVFAYTYTHTVAFDPAAASINNAFLDITFTGNRADDVEAWFLYQQGYLGDTQDPKYVWKQITKKLGFSVYGGEDYDWKTQTFDLSALLDGVSGSSWSVAFTIDEHTEGENEQMFLADSTLYGDYEPVPEPATMLLFGTGLAGLAAVGRRRAKK